MLRKPTQFRPILEPLEDRVVPRYSLIPWGEWTPIYQASVAMQTQQPVVSLDRPSSPTSSGDTDIKDPGGFGDGDGGVITPSAITRPGTVQLPVPQQRPSNPDIPWFSIPGKSGDDLKLYKKSITDDGDMTPSAINRPGPDQIPRPVASNFMDATTSSYPIDSLSLN